MEGNKGKTSMEREQGDAEQVALPIPCQQRGAAAAEAPIEEVPCLYLR